MPGSDADLVLYNGHIATLDAVDTVVSALVARGGRIIQLGADAPCLAAAGANTRCIDLAGRTVIPGIIDSHCHPDAYAARLARWINLGPDRYPARQAVLGALREHADTLAPEDWCLGFRLDEQKSGGYPSLDELDAASGGRPLFILRTDGHLGLANRAALRALGVDRDTPDPPFGRFDRAGPHGELTGLVRETAAHLFLEHAHRGDTPGSVAAGLEQVFTEFLSHGITTAYNSLTSRTGLRAYQRLHRLGKMPMRIGIIASGREVGMVEGLIEAGIQSGFGDDWLRLIGVEWCPDCSTSGRTAAYYEPYRGEPVEGEPEDNRGMLLYAREDLAARVRAAHEAGLQVMVEGVGDRGIDFALDVMEDALGTDPPADHRMRVEHCCYVTPAIQERLARLGVIDSSATGFMYQLGDAYRRNRGAEAMRHMWPHRSLIDQGIAAPGHSDAWICSPNPFTAMWSMVNRRTDTGSSLDTAEAITRTEALRAYTTLGAFSGREEHLKGSLEIGKLADAAVLDRPWFDIPDDELRHTRVDLTVVGGEVRFEREGALG